MKDETRRGGKHPKDAAVLRWVGFLGHTVVVLIDDAEDGRRCVMETCDVESAKAYVAKDCSDRNPTIYRKHGKSWSEVSP